MRELLDVMAELEERWVLRRLSDIDLSVVPPWFVEGLSTASRYEHSIHVAHMAAIVARRLGLDEVLLALAGLLHDAGCGPFPHITDELMRILTGRRGHEENVEFVLSKSPDGELSLLERIVNVDEVFQIISGGHALSPLISGPLDLDNADNVHRYISTMPSLPLGLPSYMPMEVATTIELRGGEAVVPRDTAERWASDRERLYRFLEEHGGNICAWVMISRALRLLMDELDEEFLLLGNREAFSRIKSSLPELAKGLLERSFILAGRFELRGELAGRVSVGGRTDWSFLAAVEEEVLSETGLPEWAVGVEVLRSKACTPWNACRWRGYLVIHSLFRQKSETAAGIVSRKLGLDQ